MMFHSMMRRGLSIGLAGVLLLALSITAAMPRTFASPTSRQMSAPATAPGLLFVENSGQFPDDVRFLVYGSKQTQMWLAEDALWLTMVQGSGGAEAQGGGVNLKLSFPNTNPHPKLEPFGRRDTVFNYYHGNDPARWRAGVPVWSGVRYADIYPGVDLEITGQGNQFVWRLTPKSPFPSQGGSWGGGLQLRVEGADDTTLADGFLHLSTVAGAIDLPLLSVDGDPPAPWPAIVRGEDHIFTVTSPILNPQSATPRAPADSSSVLHYSTFLGGNSSDLINAIAMDAGGFVYVTGATTSANFPVTPGALDDTYSDTTGQSGDVFVAKLDPRQSGAASLLYATFLGGQRSDVGKAIAVDAGGDIYVQGETTSTDFPTHNPYQGQPGGSGDGFLVRISAAGDALRYATFLGGSDTEYLYDALAVDRGGQATMVGYTYSTDFPITPGAFQTSFAGGELDVFVTRLDTAKSGAASMVFSTYLGGSGKDFGIGVAVDEAGNTYVTGHTQSDDFPTRNPYQGELGGTVDVFVTKLDSTGGALVYSTYLGGNNALIFDRGWGIAVDAAGRAVVTGDTKSSDFPTTPGAFQTRLGGSFDTFVTQFNPSGDGLVFSTLFGGSKGDYGHDVAVDAAGNVYVAGHTSSEDLPIRFPTQASNAGGVDAFLMQLSPAGDRLFFSTYLGGSDDYYIDNDYWDGATDVAVSEGGLVAVGGYAQSEDFPTTANAYQPSYAGGDYDGFVATYDLGAWPDLSPSSKRAAPDKASVGQVITFTVNLANQGKLSAATSLTDTLPVGLLLQGSPSASAGDPPAVDGPTLTWQGIVDSGAAVTITFAARLTSTTTLAPTVVNTAYIADGRGVVFLRSAYVNGYTILLPLVEREAAQALQEAALKPVLGPLCVVGDECGN